jgi:hypothetical protein
MNKGVLHYYLRKQNYSESAIQQIQSEEDLIKFGEKNKKLLEIIFYVNGLLEVNLKNCWLTLKRETQIEKLCKVSRLLKHDCYKRDALIAFYVNKIKNGRCFTKDLNVFLNKYGEEKEEDADKLFTSREVEEALSYIYNMNNKLNNNGSNLIDTAGGMAC